MLHETICKAVRRGAEPQYGPHHVREADLRIPRHQEVERGADQHQMQHMRTFAGEETSGRAQVVDRGDAADVAAVGSAEPDETLHDGGRTEPHDRDFHHGHRTNRRVQHAAEHGGNERARLVHYVHHGHRATHHILAMGAEHLRQRRLHRRRLHRVKHGEHHLHHGYRRQIETGGRKDRRADEHRHGGKRVKRHHDGPTVRTIRHHAATRFVPIPQGLWDRLWARIRRLHVGPRELVFTNQLGHPVREATERHHWLKALEAAGLPQVRIHSARHWMASMTARAGMPEDARISIMGHVSLQMTMHYTHRDAASLGRLMVAAIPDLRDDEDRQYNKSSGYPVGCFAKR